MLSIICSVLAYSIEYRMAGIICSVLAYSIEYHILDRRAFSYIRILAPFSQDVNDRFLSDLFSRKACLSLPRPRRNGWIPAFAGMTDFLHIRGEDQKNAIFAQKLKETPPRAWGRHLREILDFCREGNTPTGVGKTFCWR